MRAPPYLVSFENLEDFYQSLADDTVVLHKTEIDALAAQNLPPVVSIRCLAVMFGYSPKLVGSFLKKTEKYYRVFDIRSGKKKRRIEAPKVGLKVIQKWLGEYLSNGITLNECVYGFVPGRSYVTAAKKHLNARWVYSIDIENFFQTTPHDMVRQAFINLGYPDRGAAIAAKLCCYGGHLAQGSPASPVLSNLIFSELDTLIAARANELQITYTRYADDLVFSGSGAFPEEIKNIKNLIEDRGWKIATRKEHFAELPNRLKVHGLLVHGNTVRLTKGYRNKIRAYKHLLEGNRVTDTDMARIKGHINLADHIEAQSS